MSRAILLLLAVAAPGLLPPVQRSWMAVGHAISKVTTPIFLGIVYFVVITPIGFVKRRLGVDGMVHNLKNGSYWISRDESNRQPPMDRQF